MKIEPFERIKSGGEYKPANKVCDVPNEVGKELIDKGKAKSAAGRPSGGAKQASQGGEKTPTAAELVAEIATMEDIERLQQLAEDTRKTVSDAANARLDELEDEEGDDGDDGDPDDPGA